MTKSNSTENPDKWDNRAARPQGDPGLGAARHPGHNAGSLRSLDAITYQVQRLVSQWSSLGGPDQLRDLKAAHAEGSKALE